MTTRLVFAVVSAALASPVAAQSVARPVPPIDTVTGAIVVNVADFASIPDVAGLAARPMLMVDEPGTRRFFVNDMRGPISSVSYDGTTVALYVDINDSTWGVHVQSQGRERGVQSFAFHPSGGGNTHHTVPYEWTAKDARATAYGSSILASATAVAAATR